jgi:hypothetical protein
VLEHFEAGYGIESAGHFIGQLFDRNLAVIDLLAAFQQMQLGDAEWLFRKVDTGHRGAPYCHAFREQAAATADVEYALAGNADGLVDPVQAKRVDVVQRLELAVRVPPVVSEVAKLFQFGRVSVEWGQGVVNI